ncbi:primosomal protein N' [Sedimenticola thiotaurini]|uniref:Replication restart protein PriA n=1 Tax=Sedimenticola thiotaurini TaxID=1543721 RepID=A0A0F7K2U3_9GAMM|nr:primosomal protein N' [Sedimenticola thiotaurini]AKH21248.1 primosomal protein N' [Sedimenticola thiotaurini]
MPEQLILRVAVPAPLHHCFDYLPPDDVAADRLIPGVRVRVPFGRGERCGVLLELVSPGEGDGRRLKAAGAILDPQPLFSADDLALLRWAAGYYHHPIGEVIANALPVRLRKGEAPVPIRQRIWSLTPLGKQQERSALRRAPKQAELLDLLRESGGSLEQTQLLQICGSCRPALKALADKDWISVDERLPEAPGAAPPPAPSRLNGDQQSAVDGVDLERFDACLLDGVTGSGKTEVYLELVGRVLAKGRQALVLVPEIGLTPQLIRRFERRLGQGLAVLHSGLAAGERERAWHLARLGHAAVVLGTRSALLTPLPRLGLIVVDEEHDLSFKQQDGFRYSARDLAVIRAQRTGCPVILGSATPSLESLQNARAGRYTHLRLTQRAGEAKPARMDLLDIRSVRMEAGLSPVLLQKLRETLDAGNQALLFINRRGFAPIVTCHACGWVAQCRRCDARMTLHAASRLLWCHHCGSQRRQDDKCPECGDTDLRSLGQGTERVEQVLASCFPDVGIARIDRDSTRRKGSLDQLLNGIRTGKYSLLLGTQMLAKGHHFPDVTLVGILDVDQGLFGADFRAAERMAQLIIQVAGRAGRAEKPGRVLIQTRHPDHPMMQLLVHRGYAAFADEMLAERQAAAFPPFSYQALLRAEAPREQAPREFLDEARELAENLSGGRVELWGPVPAPMERRAGRYRAHLLLQADQRTDLQRLLSAWVHRLAVLKSARRVRWSIDVDPQEMF